MSFPKNRMRRLRSSDAMRHLVRQTIFNVNNLVYPLFVREGKNIKEPIKSMTDCFHFSPDTIVEEAQERAKEIEVPGVLESTAYMADSDPLANPAPALGALGHEFLAVLRPGRPGAIAAPAHGPDVVEDDVAQRGQASKDIFKQLEESAL